ncbi:unnamed protein product [Ixodes pacificus]
MSLDRHITECFKMKKPKASPEKSCSSAATTPKRRAGKSKLASSVRGFSTPVGKTGGSRRDASPDLLDQSCYETTVDLNTIADDLLCSQDVVAADVIWDCSSPRNKVFKVRKNGESDVKNLVKHFRSKPKETEPAALSILDIIGTSYNHTPPRAKPDCPRKQRNLASDAANAQVIMEEMHMLLDMMKRPGPNGSGATFASTSRSRDVEKTEKPARIEKSAAKVASPPSPTSDEKWAGEDDSLLVAATQEIEMTAEMRTPSRLVKVSPASPSVPTAALQTPPNISTFASPMRCHLKRASPRDRSSLLRKSPRLRALSLSRTSSPPQKRSLVPVAMSAAERAQAQSPGPIFDEDDGDEALLDQICSTYEQQQELERKMAAKCPPPRADSGTATTSSRLDRNKPSPAEAATTLGRSVHVATSGLLINEPKSVTGFKPCGVTARVASKTAGSEGGVAFGSGKKGAVSSSLSAHGTVPSSRKATPYVTPLNYAHSKVAGTTNDCGVSKSADASSRRLGIVCGAKVLPPTLLPGARNGKHVSGVVSSGSNSWVVSTTATGRSAVSNRSGTLAVLPSVAQPSSSRNSAWAVATAATRSLPTVPKSKSPFRTQARVQLSRAKTTNTADASIDFGDDDDDTDFATPDVVSWLEKVESQRAPSQKCTPEEIAKKREEALRRRQLKAAQAKHQWRGRLRPSR